MITRKQFIRSALGITILSGWPFRKARAQELPNVFIIGDSISIGYTPVVKQLLEGKAIVSRPNQNCNGTKLGIVKIDEWLGDGKYDLIHFNFGLHDVKHVDVKTGEGSNNPSDPVQSDLPTYERNLETIVERLKQTGARLIFATSTSVPEKNDRVMREPSQLLKYNEAAVRIMSKHAIRINDLFTFSQTIVAEHQNRNDVHFTLKGYSLLAEQVAAAISNDLRI